MEADLVIEEDVDVGERMDTDIHAVADAPEMEMETDIDERPLPEIEVDEWIDLEDQWEKDYYFVVFTDDELFQYMYALYYPVLKDEAAAQHLSRQQVASLKATLKRMSLPKFSTLPENVLPVFRGTRSDLGGDTENYLQLYKRIARLPYAEGRRQVAPMYLRAFAPEAVEPFLTLSGDTAREFLLSSGKPTVTETEELEGGAPRRKAKAKAKAKPTSEPESKTEEPNTPEQRLVVLPSDATPLPVEAIHKMATMPHTAIPELSLKERVEHVRPGTAATMPVDALEWKQPSSLLRAIHLSSQYPLDTVLEGLTTVPSLHQLKVHLATYGYALDEMPVEAFQTLVAHLESLPAPAATKTHTRKYAWNGKPVSGLKPSEMSIFVPLGEWVKTAMADAQKHRSDYQERLALLEKQSDIFQKHPGIALDIYDLAVRIRQKQIDLEEAIQTLAAMHREADMQAYVDFLTHLLRVADADDATDAMATVTTDAQAHWSRMDASIFPERTPVLREHHSEHAPQPGRPSYLHEDIQFDRMIDEFGEGEEEDAIGDTRDTTDEMTLREETTDVFDPEEPESETPWVAHLPATLTTGQRDLLVAIGGMLHALHVNTELPLPYTELFQFLIANFPAMAHLSVQEQLHQAFPDIPSKDLTVFLTQRMLWYAFEAPEQEAAFRKKVSETHQAFKKSTLELFIYAVTWWVIYLQDAFIRQPKQMMPVYAPCLPVWAFYGTPMSSSDEKGIARYLVCTSLSLLENDPDHPRWALLRAVPEKKFLDRIYKYSQLPEFTEKVAYLKQQWKERWKEVARKEKEMELRLDVLEKSVGNPKEYLSLYVSLMVRLPTLLVQKKQTLVAPVANSCCYQPLSQQFQAFGDFKEAGLYPHQQRLMVKGKHPIQPLPLLGRVKLSTPVLPGVDSTTFFSHSQCKMPYTLPDAPKEATLTPHGVRRYQWNALCAAIGQRAWAVPDIDTDAPLGDVSVLHIRRANQAMETLLKTYVTKNKSLLTLWEEWLEHSSWADKTHALTLLRTEYKKEQSLYAGEWVEEANARAITQISEWIHLLQVWPNETTSDAPAVLMTYILYAAALLPFVPDEDLKNVEMAQPTLARKMLERRFEIWMHRAQRKRAPSQRAIQDYYAAVREKLKINSLAEYKSKTIDEIKELQDAKRLNLKKVFDQSYPTEPTPTQQDDAYEAEGLAEHRAFASWNADEMNPDHLDE